MKKNILFSFLFCYIATFGYGQIKVKLTLPNNCYVDFTTQSNLVNTRDVPTLKISPNPNTGTFTLDFSDQNVLGKLIVSIYNTKGKVVYQEIVFSDSYKIVKKISLNDFLPGVYVLEVKSNKRTTISKLVINQNR